MAKKELEIKEIPGDSENSKIFVLSQSVKGFSYYERTKAIERFINSETKVLEMAIETYLRQVLRDNGIVPMNGNKDALERALIILESRGKRIEIYDRYCLDCDERIVGESPNYMTCILEDDILSVAMEVEVVDYGG